MDPSGENLTEAVRLIPKRLFIVIADDDKVQDAIDILIKTNQTGHPGDGKIFVVPVYESYRVRNGEPVSEAY